jgi:hypothetical protein
MRNIFMHRALLLAAAWLIAAAPVLAQFDEEPAPGEAPAAAPADQQAPIQDAINAAALTDFGRHDPIIAAVLELPRDTPTAKLRAVLTLVDLGHTDVAALLLPELLAAPLDDAQRAELVRQFGSASFMRLIRLDAPAAKGATGSPLAGAREFAQKCIDAAAAAATDPARIAEILAQLNAPTEEARYAARVDLRATGEAGIAAAMTALATAKTPEARGNLLAALAELRPAVDAPLVAVLAEGRGQVRADAAMLAGQLKIRAALPWLAALAMSSGDPAAHAAQGALAKLGIPAPTPADAQALLRHELSELDAAPLLAADDVHDRWWTWDAAKNMLTVADFPPRQYRVLARARLARALAEAGSEAPADRRLTMVDVLEAAQLLGRELSADDKQQLAAMKPPELSAAIAAAVDGARYHAAARLVAELGARQDASVLSSPDGRPVPLAAVLDNPDRELRYAALAAVMQLHPQQKFPGSSALPRALWYFAAGAGEPAIVVAAPVLSRASDWAGQLRARGFEATPAATGRGALAAALDRVAAPRLAAIVLDSDIDHPPLREVVFQLRQSPRTARVPIVVATSTEHYASAQRLAAVDPLVLVAPRPQGEAALAELLDRAVALAAQPLADKGHRTAQAKQSLQWIAKLLAENAPYDELRRDAELANHALFVPELVEPAIAVLGAVGSANSQATLADFASARTLPVEVRRAAVAALTASFKRYGIQLTSQQMLAQYDRYNSSESADADTQHVLSSILDALEKKPTPTAAPNQLPTLPPAQAGG